MIRVDVQLQPSHQESYVFQQIRQLLPRITSRHEAQQIRHLADLRVQGIDLADIEHGSIRLYFLCHSLAAVSRLEELLENVCLRIIIEDWFVALLVPHSKVTVTLVRKYKQEGREQGENFIFM